MPCIRGDRVRKEKESMDIKEVIKCLDYLSHKRDLSIDAHKNALCKKALRIAIDILNA